MAELDMNLLIGMPQGAEWLVILAIVILVFGAAKLPDLARGTGQALRIFKNETKGLRDDDKSDEDEGTERADDAADTSETSRSAGSGSRQLPTSGSEEAGSRAQQQSGQQSDPHNR